MWSTLVMKRAVKPLKMTFGFDDECYPVPPIVVDFRHDDAPEQLLGGIDQAIYAFFIFCLSVVSL